MMMNSIGPYVVISVLVIAMTGCQSPTTNKHVASPNLREVNMSVPVGKFNGVVGNVQYSAFELGPVDYSISSSGVLAKTVIAGKGFAIMGLSMEQVAAIITLVHEASLGKRLDIIDDKDAFVTRLRELMELHKDYTKDMPVLMNGVPVAGSIDSWLEQSGGLLAPTTYSPRSTKH